MTDDAARVIAPVAPHLSTRYPSPPRTFREALERMAAVPLAQFVIDFERETGCPF